MPLHWKALTFLQVLLFLTAAIRIPSPVFRLYALACAPAGIIWGLEMWQTSIEWRPLLLETQALVIAEALTLFYWKCSNPSRRIRFAAYLTLLMVAGTLVSTEYRGFPKGLFWAQLWLEVAGIIFPVGTLWLWLYWKAFPAAWEHRVNLGLIGLYCAFGFLGMTYQNGGDWVLRDELVSLGQSACLLGWIALHSRNAQPLLNFSQCIKCFLKRGPEPANMAVEVPFVVLAKLLDLIKPIE